MSKLHSLSDHPVSTCGLGREKLAQSIAQSIIHCQAPKTYAIHGIWGSGKTSMLALINKHLGGESSFLDQEKKLKKKAFKSDGKPVLRTVWFEAWEHQHEINIVLVLLKEIRDQLTTPTKIWGSLKEATEVSALSFLQSINMSINLFGNKVELKDFGKNTIANSKQYENDNLAQSLPSITLKKLLQEAITKLIRIEEYCAIKTINPNKDDKLVIFIDDLDRCEPKVAFKILEAIKVHFNLRNCVFVMGMDMEAVERIMETKYKQKKNSPLSSKDLAGIYLEKICQEVHLIPTLSPNERNTFLLSLLNIDEYIKKSLQSAINEYEYLPPLPRSIKILANGILFFLSSGTVKTRVKNFALNLNAISAIGNLSKKRKPATAKEKEKNEAELELLEKTDPQRQFRVFMILAYLYSFHQELYQLLYLHKGFYGAVLQKHCDHSQTSKHLLLSSLSMLEKADLTEQKNVKQYPHNNLRNVFWIQRMIQDTFINDDDLNDFRLI